MKSTKQGWIVAARWKQVKKIKPNFEDRQSD
jgi:hypothetical protein